MSIEMTQNPKAPYYYIQYITVFSMIVLVCCFMPLLYTTDYHNFYEWYGTSLSVKALGGTYVCINVCVYAYMYMYIHIHMHMHMHILMQNKYTYTYTCICIYIYIYIHIYITTHTHTHTYKKEKKGEKEEGWQ